MEELHRTHKEVPIGWAVVVRELARAVRERRTKANPRPRSATALPEVTAGLFNLAAPH